MKVILSTVLFVYIFLHIDCFKATSADQFSAAEQQIKKAMRNIIYAKSCAFTKTDLTHICNKASIRVEAVKRLVAVNLLQYIKNLWIEPIRTKKTLKSIPKPITREGWLKYI